MIQVQLCGNTYSFTELQPSGVIEKVLSSEAVPNLVIAICWWIHFGLFYHVTYLLITYLFTRQTSL